MFTDNPSYFSLSGGTSSSTKTTLTSSTSPRGHGGGFSALFRRRACGKMGAASSQGGTSESSVHHESRSNMSGTSTPEERVPMLSRNDAVQPSGKRRSFRNLFRSVSANADHERTQKFLKGDPRPSDVAPPSPYLPHRWISLFEDMIFWQAAFMYYNEINAILFYLFKYCRII